MRGILGHTEHFCEKLFSKIEDDGLRGWAPEIRAENKRGGGAGGSRWLREDQAVGTLQDSGGKSGAVSGDFNFQNSKIKISTNDGGKAVTNESMVIDDNVGPKTSVDSIMGERSLIENIPLESKIDLVDHAVDVDNHAERKRRRDIVQGQGSGALVHDGSETAMEHFLLAGPGSQACQEQ